MVKRNLAYGKEVLQKTDIHFPKSFDRKTPVVFLIHGGGFIAGTKEDFETQAQLFCKKGFIAVNLSHRLIDSFGLINLPPTHKKSAVTIYNQLDDVCKAVGLFKANASFWGAGIDNMFMAGHSAGAVLSMLFVQGKLNADGLLKASGNWAGLTNLSLPPPQLVAKMDARWKELLFRATGAEPESENSEKYSQLNPYQVTEQGPALPHISVFPENNLIFGLAFEKELQYGYTRDYHSLLREKGVDEKLVVFKGENHGFRIFSDSWKKVIDETAGFFEMFVVG